VDKYALDLLRRVREYADGIKTRYRNVKAVKERTYKIIELTQAIVVDPAAVKEYEAFYAQPLD
jgi:hypothetical protein